MEQTPRGRPVSLSRPYPGALDGTLAIHVRRDPRARGNVLRAGRRRSARYRDAYRSGGGRSQAGLEYARFILVVDSCQRKLQLYRASAVGPGMAGDGQRRDYSACGLRLVRRELSLGEDKTKGSAIRVFSGV